MIAFGLYHRSHPHGYAICNPETPTVRSAASTVAPLKTAGLFGTTIILQIESSILPRPARSLCRGVDLHVEFPQPPSGCELVELNRGMSVDENLGCAHDGLPFITTDRTKIGAWADSYREPP